MSNDLTTGDDKKMIEPLNIVGRRSLIHSKEEAAKILKDNSYYIFVAAGLSIGIAIFLFLNQTEIGILKEYLLLMGIIYGALGVGVRKFKSRVASLLALVVFGYTLLLKIIEGDGGGSYLFSAIFCLAAYRAVKASFYYHKK